MMNQVIVSDLNRTPIVQIITWFTLATSLLAFFTHAAIKFYVFRSLTTESWFVLVSLSEYSAMILLIVSLGFSKLAVVAFVHHLTPSTFHRKINFGILAISTWWNAVSICNIVTELAIVAIELGITAQLHVKRQRKVTVMTLFSCRLLVLVAAAIQLGFFNQETQDVALREDLTLGYWRSSICNQITTCVGGENTQPRKIAKDTN
ncbi:conserved hypothetical protein [Pyrenophora tritici-repentis Pt-1C-BFP]|uniref:Rhodopsin domain-containing protein n=1 Tax=Pyrenophora tritici-repentis (strain Pt-1C-BFP) TaxID=426418 RepID=B2WCT8_PYRTR|nr:uncharacterized protein PTRG_07797 [Pyrenophora tritici-repentis Pt-1C-BFP]EDU50716.1 conserved hypothetical protein [Pyrenophora tritici-repentis Pt-1C-BFP]